VDLLVLYDHDDDHHSHHMMMTRTCMQGIQWKDRLSKAYSASSDLSLGFQVRAVQWLPSPSCMAQAHHAPIHPSPPTNACTHIDHALRLELDLHAHRPPDRSSPTTAGGSQ
jgi:hypothetical protein